MRLFSVCCRMTLGTERAMKERIARVSLVIACILCFTGFFVMCACPGWYALAVAFALVTVFLSAGRTRKASMFLAIFSGVLMIVHIVGMLHEKENLRNMKKHLEQQQRQPTNQVAPPAPMDKNQA